MLGCMWTVCVPVYAQMCLDMCDYERARHSTLTYTSIPVFVLTCRYGHVSKVEEQNHAVPAGRMVLSLHMSLPSP